MGLHYFLLSIAFTSVCRWKFHEKGIKLKTFCQLYVIIFSGEVKLCGTEGAGFEPCSVHFLFSFCLSFFCFCFVLFAYYFALLLLFFKYIPSRANVV